MLSSTRAVALASARVLHNYLFALFGGRQGLWLALAGVIVVSVAYNLLVFNFSAEFLGTIFGDAAPKVRSVFVARESLLQTSPIASAAFALILLMLTPAETHLNVSARVAGARRSAIALGEFLPIGLGIAVVTSVAGIGSIAFIAQSQISPASTFVGLIGLSVSYSFGALAVNYLILFVAGALRVPFAGARVLGLLGGLAVVAVLLANLISSVLESKPGLMSGLSHLIWGPTLAPDTPFSAARCLTLAVLMFVILVVLIAASPSSRPGESTSRLVSFRMIGRPQNLANFLLREVVLLLRHPVSQLSLIAATVLASVLVLGVKFAQVPYDISLYGLAILFASGVESTYGRSIEWTWVYRVAGYSRRMQLIAQFCGSLLGGLVLMLGASVISASSPGQFLAALPSTLVLFMTFAAAAYLAGVALPYSASAPIGMMVTSVLALTFDAIISYLSNTVGPLGSPGSLLIEAACAGVCLTTVAIIVRMRTSLVPRSTAVKPV